MPGAGSVPTLHCLRISKTGTTTLKTLVVENKIREDLKGYKLSLHGHKTSMPEVIQNSSNQVAFFLREPLARFVSGFNHRATDVPTRRQNALNAKETRVLKHFQTANDLAEALSSSNETTQDRAYVAMESEMHARLHYTDWLIGVDYLQSRLHRITFIGFLETYAQDIRQFFKVLGVEREIEVPHERRGADTSSRALSELAQENLRKWYANDIAIFEWALARRRAEESGVPFVPVPAAASDPAPEAAVATEPEVATAAVTVQPDAALPDAEETVALESAGDETAEDEAAKPAGATVTESPGRGYGFLLAGVQKAGTSTLFALIKGHPQVAAPRVKELQFFSDDRLNWRTPNYKDYHRKIKWKKSSVIAGEGTPRYLFWPRSMERIKAYNPDIRIILSFRDPIERAFSHWSMAKGRDPAQSDFGESIRAGWATRWPRRPREAGRGAKARTIVGRGFYGQQLEHALELFPREQFLLLDYHRLFKELQPSLDRIAEFIGVDPFPPVPAEKRVRAAPEELVANPPTAEDVSALAKLYAPDLQHFAELSGFDISDWPTSRVIAGTLDPADFATAMAERARLIAPPPPPEPVESDETPADSADSSDELSAEATAEQSEPAREHVDEANDSASDESRGEQAS